MEVTMKTFKWGVIGTGYIAGNFAEGLSLAENAEKAAVVGSSPEKAKAFAAGHGFALHCDTIDEMIEKARPDVIYIAVPNNFHYGYVMKALDAGIHVLCEKPMPDNARQLDEMIARAREKGVFLMEGLWTRCFPAVRKARKWMDEGAIGSVLSVHAGFGLKALEEGWQPWKRNVENAAGAIRDVGIYVLGTAQFAFGRGPEQVHSTCILEGGTDMHAEMMFQYGGGAAAFLTSSFLMTTEHHAMIYGETGAIRLGEKLWSPYKAELFRYSDTDVFTLEPVELFEERHRSQGFQFEIAHVQERIEAGEKESDYYPLAETIEIHRVIDGLRKDWGVVYATD
jgi:predicted dehydrogenase